MKLIDGKSLAAELRGRLKEKIAASEKKPGLAVVIVGNDPASSIYVRNKVKACEEVGIHSFVYALEETVSQTELENLLTSLAVREDVDGILFFIAC